MTEDPGGSDRAAETAPEAAALRRFTLFADLAPPDLDRVRRRMRVRVVEAGREIVAQGAADPGEVYFLLSGRVEVQILSSDGDPVLLAALGQGEVFGDLMAIDGDSRSTTVRAIETCRFAAMSRAAFVETVTGAPDLALRMMRILSARLRRQNERYLEKSAVDLPGRVARELLRRAATFGSAASIVPAPSPTEIARAIGARRETVSREIARLLKAGVLRREGDGLVVPDRRALAEED